MLNTIPAVNHNPKPQAQTSHTKNVGLLSYIMRKRQWCREASAVPNGVGVRPDTHPNAYGERWGNYLYISIQTHPVYADKLRASPFVLRKVRVKWR